MNSKPTVAIIGAGLAGITAARELGPNFKVTLFEKSSGLGGRMACRRIGAHRFNHGAQFLTARSEKFQSVVDDALSENTLHHWTPKLITLEKGEKRFKRTWFEPHYIAQPGMNSLAKQLSKNLCIESETEITKLEGGESNWRVHTSEDDFHGPFDWVVCTAPAPQSLTLLPPGFAELDKIAEVEFSPCFALMIGFDSKVSIGLETAVVKNSALAWVSISTNSDGDNSNNIDGQPTTSKSTTSILLHADNEWSRKHLDDDIESVKAVLLEEFERLIGKDLPAPSALDLHRWKFARCETPVEDMFLIDPIQQLAVCGDWCGGNRVEAAYLSGHQLAQELTRRYS